METDLLTLLDKVHDEKTFIEFLVALTVTITQMERTEDILPGLSNSPSDLDTTTPLTMHRFANSEDLKALFQQQIDRFPRVQVNGGKRLMFSEFEGVMIRPNGEVQNRLTNIVFPETILSIPGAGKSLRAHTDITFPQARLMADLNSDTLFAKVMADHLTDDELTERVSLILSTNDIFFNSDLWNYFSVEDQQQLTSFGFGPNMTFEQWAQVIRNYSQTAGNQYETNGRIITLRELPMNINQRGLVGTMNSFHKMPGFILQTLLKNNFTEDTQLFETGTAHIHPQRELHGASAEVAKRVGERVAYMTVSPADVQLARMSIKSNNTLLKKYLGIEKNTANTFMTIVGVSEEGQVIDIRHVDFNLIENLDEMYDLNDRADESMKKGNNMDVGLVSAHFEYFSDPNISSDEIGGNVGEPVGDPSYVRGRDEAMLINFKVDQIKDRELETENEKSKPSPPYVTGALGWQYLTIEGFLESAIAWAEATKESTEHCSKPINPWKRAAQIIHAGKRNE